LLELTNIGFDKYSDNVREADASFILSGPDVLTWGVAQCALNRIILQFGNAGGATIAFGITRPDATLLVTQRTALQEGAIFNGQLAGPNDIAILPPASHYTFANGPNHWLSISVPLDLQGNLSVHLKDALFPKRPTLVSSDPAAADGLRSTVVEQGKLVLEKEHPSAGSEEVILDALTTAIIGRPFRKPRMTTIRIEATIAKSLEFIQGEADNAIRVEDICRVVEINERNLRRHFHEYFGMSPNHYLKLRQLNAVRRAIRADSSPSITKLLALHGVTEFGRFAGEYKALFGETPSETARRNAGYI
jgi:AraC family ethanolamine operon transcriptional activator